MKGLLTLLLSFLLFPGLVWAKLSDFRLPPFPTQIRQQNEKVIVVSPRKHAWGAYDVNGNLVGYGLAAAGSDYCKDIGKPCRTKTGVYRIYAMGDETCISTRFPLPDGGAPMPYCMYFNGNQALHGYKEAGVVRANVSHGCVRMHESDAEWLRYSFVEEPNWNNNYQGTKVVILSY